MLFVCGLTVGCGCFLALYLYVFVYAGGLLFVNGVLWLYLWVCLRVVWCVVCWGGICLCDLLWLWVLCSFLVDVLFMAVVVFVPVFVCGCVLFVGYCWGVC